jgi:hypothetical protein
MPSSTILAPVYRYFVVDLLSNALLAEIPFKNVSYERGLKAAGSFSGSIPIVNATDSMDLYESTMPGKTALYVVRDGVCVWGGIIWSRSYDIVGKILSVRGSEFTSYLFHRNIWKTYTHEFEATITVTSGVAAVEFTTADYEAPVESSVRVFFYEIKDFVHNGYYTVKSSPAPTTSTFYVDIPSLDDGVYTLCTAVIRADTYDYVKQLMDNTFTDFVYIDFQNDEIEPASSTQYVVQNIQRTSDVATVTVSAPHDAILGQVIHIVDVESTINGWQQVTAIPSTSSVSFDSVGTNIPSTAIGTVTRGVTFKELTTFVATLTTAGSHGFSSGSTVTVFGVDDATAPEAVFDGEFTITAVTSNTFSYITSGVDDVPSTAVIDWSLTEQPTATVTPSMYVSTYGAFPYNSDIGLAYASDTEYSGKNVENKTYRGYELRSVGEELDNYSDTIDGFEFRVDCDYDYETNSFTKTLVLLPIDFPNPPAPGEVSPVSRFGADRLVFEYPGNISNIKMDESAENAATRFFVVGNIGDLGDEASQPYAVATAKDMLEAGWPTLDQEETNQDTGDEETLYKYAQRYLAEHRPPLSDFNVSVNGSMDPVIGTYVPGDWCSVIADDEFVRMRLASDLEPRDTVIVRKINGFKVSVPDTPTFPEKVDLDLITEPEVDKRG